MIFQNVPSLPHNHQSHTIFRTFFFPFSFESKQILIFLFRPHTLGSRLDPVSTNIHSNRNPNEAMNMFKKTRFPLVKRTITHDKLKHTSRKLKRNSLETLDSPSPLRENTRRGENLIRAETPSKFGPICQPQGKGPPFETRPSPLSYSRVLVCIVAEVMNVKLCLVPDKLGRFRVLDRETDRL